MEKPPLPSLTATSPDATEAGGSADSQLISDERETKNRVRAT
jgi:hypothetical protein